MSLKKLPKVKAFDRPDGLSFDAPSDALARWSDMPQAAEADDPGVISIYDVIGDDFFGEGITSKRVAAALRRIGSEPVTVNLNSPGGDFFEGLAIYNLLVEHPAQVNVKVMGLAASAASVIAMAGDDIQMGRGSFMMIHNAWVMAIGNQHDLRQAAEIIAPFDAAMADIYAARTGIKEKEIADMMDGESWITAKEAVDKGFADSMFEAPKGDANASVRPEIAAKRRIDAILAQHGMPRSERRSVMRDIAGMHDAAGDATHDAGDDGLNALKELTGHIRSLT